ncbi:transglutaminase, partial [Amaricoccus sp. HAR-UPW-R2A-40]
PDPAERRDFHDFFGNESIEVVFREAHDEIAFKVSSRIERLMLAPSLDISPDSPRLAQDESPAGATSAPTRRITSCP